MDAGAGARAVLMSAPVGGRPPGHLGIIAPRATVRFVPDDPRTPSASRAYFYARLSVRPVCYLRLQISFRKNTSVDFSKTASGGG